MKNYWYFFLFFIFSLIFTISILAFIALIRYKRHDYGGKNLPYECGLDPVTPTTAESHSIRFYLLALVFIVFDVETFFLFPWAVIHDQLKAFGLIEIIIFLAILAMGYVYAWKADALDFRRHIE